MPERLALLAAVLGLGTDHRALVDALYVLRAPRTLEGIVPMCRQFRDWRGLYPIFEHWPELPGYADRLVLLDRIAGLDLDDDRLMGRSIGRIQNPWTPLFGVTGDSVIGELLLTRAQGAAGGLGFEHAAVWLLWQAQRFQLQRTQPAAYAQYLRSEDVRLATQLPGRRLYEAYLALRLLAAPGGDTAGRLAGFLQLAGNPTRTDSTRLAWLFKLGVERLAAFDRVRFHTRLQQQTGWSEEVLTARIEATRTLLPPGLGRLLAMLWLGDRPNRTGSRWWRRAFLGRELYRPQITHGERLTEILQRVDADAVHAGTIIEFYPRRSRAERRRERVRGEFDDDPDEPVQEAPTLSVFLADDKELIRGYYAAKGQQNGIEYANALLPWGKWRLSMPAIKAVAQLVAAEEIDHDTRLDRCAQLAIGLSLVTGRSLAQVAEFRVEAGSPQVTRDAPVAIALATNTLWLYPGEPRLRRWPTNPPPFCRPRAPALTLPLPLAWQPLLDRLQGGDRPATGAVIARARQRLRELASFGGQAAALRITERGVRHAFLRAFGEEVQGDLGALQVITDGGEADARNIIHYASYRTRDLEVAWRRAVEALVGPLPHVRQPAAADGYVGAQHAFDVRELAKYFRTIRFRIRTAQSKDDWPRMFNLLTLYLSYWLGLGMAGRKTLAPLPNVVLAGDWALVADKHRVDGSTDRLVPLTTALREQIEAYVAFASELSITTPRLDPLVHTPDGCELRLQYIHRRRGVVPYRPKYQEQDEQLTPLPANWGRKVVRSESGSLPGRYRDAELGHWVRGRHAWDATSTLDVADFHARSLELQRELEARLGFEVIRPTPSSHVDRLASVRPGRIREKNVPAAAPPPNHLDATPLLRDVDARLVDRLLDPNARVEPAAALDLARRAIEAQQHAPVERQREVAEAACRLVRERKQIPIFATRPRPLFTNQIMLSAPALQTLAYLERSVLPGFLRDLECLPPRDPGFEQPDPVPPPRHLIATVDDGSVGDEVDPDPAAPARSDAADDVDEAESPGAKPTDEARGAVRARRVELGRLVMIAIWRLGLARWSLIEAWFRVLLSDEPVLAQGLNRYQVLRVPSARVRAVLQRTVLMDDFTAAYLAIERDRIRSALLAALFAADVVPPRRRARVERALATYLHFLRPGCARVPMAAMTAAAGQLIMLHSAPVITAYARNELNTWDLGDSELRRVAGLRPARSTGLADEPDLPAYKEHDLGVDELPGDLLRRIPLLRVLGGSDEADKASWRRHIGDYQPPSPIEQLLRNFALWLLDHRDADASELSEHEKSYFSARVKVVTYTLLAYAPLENPAAAYLDGDVLDELQEASRQEFPDRLQHGAWFQFHQFLADPKAPHAGFEIGNLGPPPERAVSAKLLSAAELARLAARLRSLRSGLGSPALRTNAQHHIELMATYGMRRAESAFLRVLDYQADLCRVQAYGNHTLKTAWAERVLPIQMAEPATRMWLDQAQERRFVRFIDAAPQRPANPDNFFFKVNQSLREVTQDGSMGSHHLRHTLINRLMVSLLWRSAGLERVQSDFPWLGGLRIESERLRAWLGAEGDAGQGLRAVSALVGHSHPSTTLRHYVHVMGIALHATLAKIDTLDLSRSFENRIDALSTAQRWATQARAGAAQNGGRDQQRPVINRVIRDRIEDRFGGHNVARDETPRLASDAGPPRTNDPDAISFDRLERVDRVLRSGGDNANGPAFMVYRDGLRWLASLRTGKKVHDKHGPQRHLLSWREPGVWLPRAVSAGTAVAAAEALCAWLELLRTTRADDFAWLVEKWSLASEHERNRILLRNAGEVERAMSLADPRWVALRIDYAIVPTDRVRLTTKEVPRLRIKCRDRDGGVITRDTIATRWVLSYVAAYHHAQHGTEPIAEQKPQLELL